MLLLFYGISVLQYPGPTTAVGRISFYFVNPTYAGTEDIVSTQYIVDSAATIRIDVPVAHVGRIHNLHRSDAQG